MAFSRICKNICTFLKCFLYNFVDLNECMDANAAPLILVMCGANSDRMELVYFGLAVLVTSLVGCLYINGRNMFRLSEKDWKSFYILLCEVDFGFASSAGKNEYFMYVVIGMSIWMFVFIGVYACKPKP